MKKYSYMNILIALVLSIVLLVMVQVGSVKRKVIELQKTISVYEQHVIPGLINNVNFYRHAQDLDQIDFYNYISDYSLYTQPIKGE